METVTIVLLLLLAVVVSGAGCRMLPVSLPRPLVQIALGAVIGLATPLRVDLDPELFFLLFLPPLLFLDGWRIPKEALFKDRATVLELALGLVVFTVLGMGLLMHWMIPAMPLAVAFALAAVLSPTDPIAVSAIASRVPFPKRLMHILEGESLLNDATGLVCMRFAVAATLTGAFSLSGAAISFLWVAIGGFVIGIGASWAATRAQNWFSERYGEESGSQILVTLLIPFGAYLAAEHLHCSGILAAVGAGIMMTFSEGSGPAQPITRIRRNNVWDMIQFTLNGIIFVLLGEQLPGLIARAAETVQLSGHEQPWWLAVYVLAINAGLAVLRFIWVWLSLQLTLFRKRHQDKTPPSRPSWRLIAAMSLAGVRGAVTLAGVLTLPLVMTDGQAFPARDLAIFLAMGVIIFSLVAASIGLPLLLGGLELPPAPSHEAEEDQARIDAAGTAIAAIEKHQHQLANGCKDADIYVSAGSRIMDLYRDRIEDLSKDSEAAALARQVHAVERDMRLTGLRAERRQILRDVRKRKLNSETARKLIRELDLLEARYTS